MSAAALAVEPERTLFPARDWASDWERDAWRWRLRPRTPEERLAQLLLRWRVDPICYAVECCRIKLQRYQGQILLDLADAPLEVFEFYGLDPTHPKRQVLVPSGHGLGKTRVSSVAGHWHKDTHRFSKTLVTAPTAEQLSGQLWGEFRKLHRRIKKRWPDLAQDWEILNASITHRDPDNGDWGVWGRTARAERPEGLQGAHALDADDEDGQLAAIFGEEPETAASGGMLVIVEEASGVPDAVREVLKGALSERGARLLAIGNPTRADGWFAEDADKRDRYAIHELDCRMSDASKVYSLPYRDFGGNVHHLNIRGFVEPRYWNDMLSECDGDEDHDRFRVRVRGKKPRSNIQQCLPTNWIEAAQKREPDPGSLNKPVVISLDFGLVNDKHGIAVRQGFNFRLVEEWLAPENPNDQTLEAARRAIDAVQIFKGRGKPVIIGDSNGVGRGAMEYLWDYFNDEERKHLGVRVIHFNAGKGALDRKRYFRRRDEMWYKHGRKFFSDPRASLPNVPGLQKQFTAPGYHEDYAKRINVETKDEVFKRTGEKSGNMADACLQSLVVEGEEETPKTEEVPLHPTMFQQHFARFRRMMGSGEDIR